MDQISVSWYDINKTLNPCFINQWSKTTEVFKKICEFCFLLSGTSNLEHLSEYFILFYFNYSHSLSPLYIYMAITIKRKKNPMWTFCLIKGLDTLPWSCRKAPFISSYWIFVCVVSVLFDFTLQFVFIMRAAERVSGRPKQCRAQFKYLLPEHWSESICITI